MTVTLRVGDRAQWRAWLLAHHETDREVWLVIPHARSATPGIGHREALEEALCVGWIDSQARKHDAESWCQRFSPRRRRSSWSARNREIVERLRAEGRMTLSGEAAVDRGGSTSAS